MNRRRAGSRMIVRVSVSITLLRPDRTFGLENCNIHKTGCQRRAYYGSTQPLLDIPFLKAYNLYKLYVLYAERNLKMPNIVVKSGEARIKFRDLLDQVLTGKGDVIIERHGKSVAVLISAAEYEQLRGKLETI